MMALTIHITSAILIKIPIKAARPKLNLKLETHIYSEKYVVLPSAADNLISSLPPWHLANEVAAFFLNSCPQAKSTK